MQIAKRGEINMLEVKESDWKLFRKRLPGWQENYMDRLNQEYIQILSGPGDPSDKFWELEKRIREDRKCVGVTADMRRSQMYFSLISLASDGAITEKDLEGFSDELVEAVKYLTEAEREH